MLDKRKIEKKRYLIKKSVLANSIQNALENENDAEIYEVVETIDDEDVQLKSKDEGQVGFGS